MNAPTGINLMPAPAPEPAIGYCNFEATTNPTSTDDETQGYSVNSFWLNITGSKRLFQCQVADEGGAVWNEIVLIGSFTLSDITGTLAIGKGGTGQTTANAAFNALAPSQLLNANKYLKTDGTNTSWATVPTGIAIGDAVTGGTNGSVLFIGSGNIQQDNANLFYDDTLNRLGVGINTSIGAKVHAKAGGGSEIAGIFQAGAASPSVNTLEVKQSDGDTIFSVGEDAIGGVMNIHANNGSISGFFKTNVGGATSGMDLGFYDYLTLINRNAGSGLTTIQSRGGTGVPAVNWEVYSGATFNFCGYNGNLGEVVMKDRGSGVEMFHGYLDSTYGGGGTPGVRFPSGKVGIGFSGAPSEVLHLAGNFKIDDGFNIVVGSTTGTKIGTASTQKLGFFGVTPTVQSGGWEFINFGGDLKTFDGGTTAEAIRVLGTLVNELLSKGLIGV